MVNKKLELIIQPRIIDQLGIKMYQNPIDVISEIVANSYDADAELVEVVIDISNHRIVISDNGTGMSFKECQDYYLNVGRDRREHLNSELSVKKGRPVLGRKGIGKFAGFGIANSIIICTLSESAKEKTKFKMDLAEILKYDSQKESSKPIEVIECNENVEGDSCTIVELILNEDIKISIEFFVNELSKRFLLPQMTDDFEIKVNGINIPENFSDEMEFVFPTGLTDAEKDRFPDLEIVDGWGKETLDGNDLYWRIGFYEETIKSEYLRGISIFSRGKIAQSPFFFELSGGISGQNALEYMTGQIKMDFVDQGELNLISTERQRINLQTDIGREIKLWGTVLVKELAQIWKNRRSQKRLQELEDKIDGFKDRLEALPAHEMKTVKSVLIKIATFERLGKGRFKEWCDAVLTSWETGRLKSLISEISEADDFDESKLIEILSEADVLTGLNIAEAIKTKIVSIGQLKLLVKKGTLENTVRDYIYERPWIIHPKWEQFKKERSVANIIKDAGVKELKEEVFNGRVDLTLSSGSTLLLLEFMRPGLELDKEHLDRINYYVINIRKALEKETGGTIERLENAYVVADSYKNDTIVNERIKQLERDNILFVTWETLIGQSIKQWEEFLELLKSRNPDDKRIQEL